MEKQKLIRKPHEKRPLGHSRCRLENNIEKDHKETHSESLI
jgi:hypothetical protein